MLGLVSISFRSLSPREIVSLCRDCGLSVIEWGSDVHAPYDNAERLAEIVRLQEESGISCSSYGTYFRLGVTPLEELPSYIAAAKTLGTRVLRIWGGKKNYETLSVEEREIFLDEAKRAAEIADRAGVTLAFECHNNTFTNCIEGALTLMRTVDSPSLRMYWQPNQHRTADINCAYAEAIAPYVVNLHVFEWKGKNRYPLRDGVALWREYLSYFKGDENLLLEFMPDDDPRSLPAEVNALKEIAQGFCKTES